jgi:hypothetical protein
MDSISSGNRRWRHTLCFRAAAEGRGRFATVGVRTLTVEARVVGVGYRDGQYVARTVVDVDGDGRSAVWRLAVVGDSSAVKPANVATQQL